MRVVIMGAPGAGKGTQAALIARELDVPAISTGDIFRSHVANGTPLGTAARRYMDAGDYVPDTVTNDMVRSRLGEPDVVRGFVLDGYPRTVAQVEELDRMLGEANRSVDVALCLGVELDELVERLSRRARSEGRSDDTPEVIRRRQLLYVQATEPLLSIYRNRGCLRLVDGTGEVDDVTARLLHAVRSSFPVG